jgi:hypothetical protein
MYSGTTIRNASGNIMGAHQKFDRIARRMLEDLVPESDFPPIKLILHFEGKNGPDGVKRKSPAQDEPWHYYDPKSEENGDFLKIINDHYHSLVQQLANHNQEKAAFEAAWLAHALVDGLTPAHHYPYEEKLAELRGEGIETRDTLKDKLIIGGEGTLEILKNNWKMWGAKGLMTTHGLFELGVATIITPLRLKSGMPHEEDLVMVRKEGVPATFEHYAHVIDSLHMYERYYRLGWTKKLNRQVRQDLAPAIVKMVTLAWYAAQLEAQKS